MWILFAIQIQYLNILEYLHFAKRMHIFMSLQLLIVLWNAVLK